MASLLLRHRLVPEFLVRRFADEGGRVMAERRDRNRRLALHADEAGAEVGFYTVVEGQPGAADLERLLSRTGERAAVAVERVVTGTFPPAGEDRAWLSVFIALQLLLGRGQRDGVGQAAGLMSELIVPAIEQLEEAAAELEEEGSEETASEGDAHAEESPADASPEPPAGHVLVHDGEPVRVSLAGLPGLARFVSERTWQLLRFPSRLVLTGDTPVVLWSRPGGAKSYQFGLGTADEVRMPLDPRHALVVARTAPAGEVVRELTDRHARALNRTVAEAAREWMYYHPDSDPLEQVELAPPASDD
ncbi:MAG: DUF4238 domain-containing protein [Candidatus Rokubacteria bacterium]|nr:DUF4238 domain-containing protein [Candidatus Rokubacteria bacterium]